MTKNDGNDSLLLGVFKVPHEYPKVNYSAFNYFHTSKLQRGVTSWNLEDGKAGAKWTIIMVWNIHRKFKWINIIICCENIIKCFTDTRQQSCGRSNLLWFSALYLIHGVNQQSCGRVYYSSFAPTNHNDEISAVYPAHRHRHCPKIYDTLTSSFPQRNWSLGIQEVNGWYDEASLWSAFLVTIMITIFQVKQWW